jgi:hypothetical protein
MTQICVFDPQPLGFALVKSIQTTSTRCAAVVKGAQTRGLHKAGYALRKELRLCSQDQLHFGFPRVLQMDYAKCW